MPVLANVKISALGGDIQVAATDLEISLLASSEAVVSQTGEITVDAKVFYEIVKELPSGQISLSSSSDQRLEISAGQSRFKINGTAAAEFPAINGIEIFDPIAVDAKRLCESLDKTFFAVSQDEARFNLNGVFVESISTSSPSKIRFVATDGHRMAMIDRQSDGFELEEGVIIPRKGIGELRKVLESQEGIVHVGVSEGFFTLRAGKIQLGIRLVDGQFPDYRQVIPVKITHTFKLERSDLLSAIRRIALLSSDKSKTLRFKVSNLGLFITASSPEHGEASESVDIEDLEGSEIALGFSAKYLNELLGAMPDSDTISVKLSGELGPALFQGNADEHYTGVIMPMRFE